MSTQATSGSAEPNTDRPGDAIRLTVPARPEFVAVVQTATSALALGCGLAAGDVEGLCAAVAAAIAILIEVPTPETIEIGFDLATNRLSVAVEVTAQTTTLRKGLKPSQRSALAMQLQFLVEHVRLNDAGTVLAFSKSTAQHGHPTS